MALRARLTAPRAAREEWPWHTAKTTSLRASMIFAGDRRMEAENYLAGGYGTRIAIEAKATGWVQLKQRATTSQPSRLKGVQVGQISGHRFSQRHRFMMFGQSRENGFLSKRRATLPNGTSRKERSFSRVPVT